MKAFRIILVILALIFIVMQFLPSGIPANIPEDEKSISKSVVMNDRILDQLRVSCFDCHSNQTRLPWYSKIAPSSWYLADHIKEGRSTMNFSEWENYSRREKIGYLEEIKEVIEDGEMPLKSYLLIHRKAKLDQAKISLLTQWADSAMKKILE